MARTLVLSILLAACESPPSPAFSGGPVACVRDADCDDGNPCTGVETCVTGACAAGRPPSCEPDATCVVQGEEAVCDVLCPLPVAPVLQVLIDTEALHFRSPAAVQTAVDPIDDDVTWHTAEVVEMEGRRGPVQVLARAEAAICRPDEWFDHTYEVASSYPGPVGSDDNTALPMHDSRIVAWATHATQLTQGEAVDPLWHEPTLALGPAEGTAIDVLSLGRGGQVTLGFETAISDGPGPDFVVFENSFGDTFLELATVEVSTDGTTFAAFDTASHTPEPIGAYGELDVRHLAGFAGLARAGHGTPFDLGLLTMHPLVRTGQLDLRNVRFVRVIDVVGDGQTLDSFGRPVFDPYPTAGSAGFDLDAVGVLHEGTR